jgi:hypothetical protein
MVFVDLAAVTQPDLVLPAIVRALGLRGVSNREPRARVQAFLRAKRLLLVLDNFEQVLAAAPVVAGLLAGARGPSAGRSHVRVGVRFADTGRLPGCADDADAGRRGPSGVDGAGAGAGLSRGLL